jgi:transposase
MRERIAHTNRISALLVLHNLRPHLIIGGRDWARWWSQHAEQVTGSRPGAHRRRNAQLVLSAECAVSA